MMLGIRQAAMQLGISKGVAERMVRLGYVAARLTPDRRRSASLEEWRRGLELYRREHPERHWVVGGRRRDEQTEQQGAPYNPLRRAVMTESVYAGFEIVYGQPPVCCVCGRQLVPGTMWRWYVPSDMQRAMDLPVLALGCAEGHEGTVIRVGSQRWRIGPEGERPERCEAG